MRRDLSPSRMVATATAFVVALGVSVPPAAAVEVKSPSPATARSLAAAAAAAVATVDISAALAPAQEPATAPSGGKGFFKTTKGVIALVMMVGLVGYTVHSRSADHVHSPIR